MAETITCRFPVWRAEEGANATRRFFRSLSEQLDLAWMRHEQTFTITTETPEYLLTRGTSVDVDADAIGRADRTKFYVESWKLRIDDARVARIDLYLREEKPSPLNEAFGSLSEEAQQWIGGISAALTLFAVGFLCFATVYYPEPQGFWAAIARRIYGIVQLLIVGTSLMLFFLGMRRFEQAPFLSRFIGFLCLFVGVLSLVVWDASANPPRNLADDAHALAYLDGLVSNGKTLAPMVAVGAPWFALFAKWFGWDVIAGAFANIKEKSRKAT